LSTKKSKLLTVLATLDTKEWKSLKKYLLRHTSNASDNLMLIDYLHAKRNKLSEMNLQEVHADHFSTMSSKAVMNMFSRVYLWVEEWISVEEMLQDSYESDLHLIKSYNRKGLYHLADQVANKLEKQIRNDKLLDIKKTEALKKIAHYQYYSNNPIKSTQAVNLLQQLAENHLTYFKEESLTYLIELHNVNERRKQPLIKEIEKISELTSHIEDTELSQMMQMCKALMVDHSYEAFLQLCKKIKLLNTQSTVHMLFYTYLTMGWRKLWVKNIITDSKYYIELLDYGVNAGVYFIGGKMSVLSFHNLISGIATYSDQKTASYYANNWIGNVKTRDILSTKSIAEAIINFYSEKYDNIYSLLSLVNYEDNKQKTRGLCTQAIALYMTHQDDILFDHLFNLKRLINRNMKNIKGSYYESQLNLITVIELLNKKRYDSKIEINLSEYSPLFYRSWCLKMCQ